MSDKTIGTLRESMESMSEIPTLTTLVRRDGRQYPRNIVQPSKQKDDEEQDSEPELDLFRPYVVLCADSWSLGKLAIPPVHLVVTSPPYKVGIDYNEHDDAMPAEQYFQFIEEVWRGCYEVMVPGGRIAVVVPFGIGRNPWEPFASSVMQSMQTAGFTLRGQIVWDKGTSGGRTAWGSFRLPTDPGLRDTTECIIVAHKGQSKLDMPVELYCHDTEGSYSPFMADSEKFMTLAQDHWVVPPESAQRVGHPAPFPVEIPARLIAFYAYPGAHILDPFAGSGSTGVAAVRMGCKVTLIDKDQRYCDMAERRCRDEFALPSSR